MSMILTITDAGRQALVNAQNTGTLPLVISHVELGRAKYNPAKTQTTLQDKIKPIATFGGGAVAPDVIHITIHDETTDAYPLGEFGLITSTGVLFAVYSQPDEYILEKNTNGILLLSVDTKIATLDITNIQFSGTNFILPPASRTVAGILMLADNEEALAGINDNKAMTAKTTKAVMDEHKNAEAAHHWIQITNKPATYPPSNHGHPWEQISNKPVTYPATAHTHDAGDVVSGKFSDDRLPTAQTGKTFTTKVTAAGINNSGWYDTTGGVNLTSGNGGGPAIVARNTLTNAAGQPGGWPYFESLGARGDSNVSFQGRIGLAYRRTDGNTIVASQNIGSVLFGGQWGTETEFNQAKLAYSASVIGVAEGNFTNWSAMPTAISFRTGSTGEEILKPNASYGIERFRINSTGQLIANDASGLKNLNASYLTGQVPAASLPFSYSIPPNAGHVVQRDGNGDIFGRNLVASNVVYAANGIVTNEYLPNQRNPIWRFGNAVDFGISYFQGPSGYAGTDSIGFHFGANSINNTAFIFTNSGNMRITGQYVGDGAGLKNLNYSQLSWLPVQQGGGIGQTSNKVYIGWADNGLLKCTVDATDVGIFAFRPWVESNFAANHPPATASEAQQGTSTALRQWSPALIKAAAEYSTADIFGNAKLNNLTLTATATVPNGIYAYWKVGRVAFAYFVLVLRANNLSGTTRIGGISSHYPLNSGSALIHAGVNSSLSIELTRNGDLMVNFNNVEGTFNGFHSWRTD